MRVNNRSDLKKQTKSENVRDLFRKHEPFMSCRDGSDKR